MKTPFFIPLVACLLLAACTAQGSVPTVTPSYTPEPSITATPMATSTPIPTPTRIQPTELPSTPTVTPFPVYARKNVVFDYYIAGNQADWDLFFDPPSGNIVTKLVLYDDGQMLVAGAGETYQQKVLSSGEINSFLEQLETLGVYALESNQKHDPTDQLYDFGNNYQEFSGGLKGCILVNGGRSRNLCISEPRKQYLIPQMQDLLKYLDEYLPAGLTPYTPERILLSIQVADPSIDNPPASIWDEGFPPLKGGTGRFVSDTLSQVMYIDGDMAVAIHQYFEGAATRVVSQDAKEYIVQIRVLLPHETVKNPIR